MWCRMISAPWRQVSFASFLALCAIEALTESHAEAVAALAGKAGHDGIVDVAVVDAAIGCHDAIVTSDPAYLRKIADAVGAKITIDAIRI
jgi:hypothetical protein